MTITSIDIIKERRDTRDSVRYTLCLIRTKWKKGEKTLLRGFYNVEDRFLVKVQGS